MANFITSLTNRIRGFLLTGENEVPALWWDMIDQIQSLRNAYHSQTDAQLFDEWHSLRYRVQSGESLTNLLPEAFAIVSEQMQRHLGLTPYPVQYLGAFAMHDGAIAEMQTGEGKTLTAALTLCLNALPEAGIHIATANDYLAERDAAWLSPVYHSLGMTVGVITSNSSSAERRDAYDCDITYGTAREFGFDYLRDLLSIPGQKMSINTRRQSGRTTDEERLSMGGCACIAIDGKRTLHRPWTTKGNGTDRSRSTSRPGNADAGGCALDVGHGNRLSCF